MSDCLQVNKTRETSSDRKGGLVFLFSLISDGLIPPF